MFPSHRYTLYKSLLFLFVILNCEYTALGIPPAEIRKLGNSFRSRSPFTEQELTSIDSLTIAEKIALFELFGNSTDPSHERIDNRIKSVDTKTQKPVQEDGSFEAECYHIPIKFLDKQILDDLDPKVVDSFLVRNEKNQPMFYRWFIHPEDRVYSVQVEEFLKKKRISTERHSIGKGYLTASRTCLIVPSNGLPAYFVKSSLKSMKGPFGEYSRKVGKQEVSVGFSAARANRQWISDRGKDPKDRNLKTVFPLRDSAAFVLPKLSNLGQLIRPLEGLDAPNGYLLPGFVAIHETLGPKLALLDKLDPDAQDPAVYWRKHYAEPVGRALAEIFVTAGLVSRNPHSQNFLIEADRGFKPTGRIAARDFSDYQKSKNCTGWAERGPDWEIIFGLFSSSVIPSWLSAKDLKDWRYSYNKAFAERLSEMTSIPIEEFSLFIRSGEWLATRSGWQPSDYTLRSLYSSFLDRKSRWFNLCGCYRGEPRLKNGLDCSAALECIKSPHSVTSDGRNCEVVISLIGQWKRVTSAQLKSMTNCSSPDDAPIKESSIRPIHDVLDVLERK